MTIVLMGICMSNRLSCGYGDGYEHADYGDGNWLYNDKINTIVKGNGLDWDTLGFNSDIAEYRECYAKTSLNDGSGYGYGFDYPYDMIIGKKHE